MSEAEERPDASTRLDPGVIASLYLEHADELRAFLAGVLRDKDLAADALQATFAKAVEIGHTSREETRKGWLFRVAFHEALQIKRRGRVDERSTRTVATSGTKRKPGRASGVENGRPEERLVRFEVVARVREALERLPEGQREVVRKRIYEEKTFATIAEEMGLPLGTVLTRMRAAMEKLAGRLREPDE